MREKNALAYLSCGVVEDEEGICGFECGFKGWVEALNMDGKCQVILDSSFDDDGEGFLGGFVADK